MVLWFPMACQLIWCSPSTCSPAASIHSTGTPTAFRWSFVGWHGIYMYMNIHMHASMLMASLDGLNICIFVWCVWVAGCVGRIQTLCYTRNHYPTQDLRLIRIVGEWLCPEPGHRKAIRIGCGCWMRKATAVITTKTKYTASEKASWLPKETLAYLWHTRVA